MARSFVQSRDFHPTSFRLPVTANPLAEGASQFEHLTSLEHTGMAVVAGSPMVFIVRVCRTRNPVFTLAARYWRMSDWSSPARYLITGL